MTNCDSPPPREPAKTPRINFTVRASRTASSTNDEAFKKAVAENARITQSRLKSAGLFHEIKMEDDSTYVISLDNSIDTTGIRELLTNNIKVDFYEVYTFDLLQYILPTFLEDWMPVLKKELTAEQLDQLGKNFFQEKKNLATVMLVSQPGQGQFGGGKFPPHIGVCRPADTILIRAYFNSSEIRAKFPADFQLLFGPEYSEKPGSLVYVYATRTTGFPLTQELISDARAVVDETNKPALNLKFNEEGTQKWKSLTERNISKHIAICVNDLVLSAPTVIQRIDHGDSRISGIGSMETCRRLAILLKNEELPLPAKLVQIKINVTPAP